MAGFTVLVLQLTFQKGHFADFLSSRNLSALFVADFPFVLAYYLLKSLKTFVCSYQYVVK
jgi:hypothetical protein